MFAGVYCVNGEVKLDAPSECDALWLLRIRDGAWDKWLKSSKLYNIFIIKLSFKLWSKSVKNAKIQVIDVSAPGNNFELTQSEFIFPFWPEIFLFIRRLGKIRYVLSRGYGVCTYPLKNRIIFVRDFGGSTVNAFLHHPLWLINLKCIGS